MKPTQESSVCGRIYAASRGARNTGFGTVEGYRLYRLDGVAKVASAEWIEADDDEAAIEAATKMMDGHAWELWHSARLIYRRRGTERSDADA